VAISQTTVHVAHVVEQIIRNLRGLHRDMRDNAQSWKTMAAVQNPTVAILRSYMADAVVSYQTRLSWVNDYKNTNANWPAVMAMMTAQGMDTADVAALYSQLKTVADQLQAAAPTLTTYASINGACDQILAAVQAPDSLWPE
jgi:hypothetical protein